MSEAPKWRLRLSEQVRIARFGDEALVFNPLSWQTHLVNDSTLQVIEALRRGSCSVVALAQLLYGSELEGDDATQAESIVTSLLEELRLLGLCEPEVLDAH